jgi:hypothetical protein
VTLAELEDDRARERAWIGPEESVGHMGRIEVEAAEAERLRHGQAVTVAGEGVSDQEPVAVLHDGRLLAVGACEGGVVRPRKVFSA